MKGYKECHKVHRPEVNFGEKYKDQKKRGGGIYCAMFEKRDENKRDVFEKDGRILSRGIKKLLLLCNHSHHGG